MPPASITRRNQPEELREPLTTREREVLRLLAAGLGNKEIAAKLSISEHTAKFHVASILGKLGAASRTEAVALGMRHGLILL
jgi:DNA-binding NarL/FixJ family response regulator